MGRINYRNRVKTISGIKENQGACKLSKRSRLTWRFLRRLWRNLWTNIASERTSLPNAFLITKRLLHRTIRAPVLADKRDCNKRRNQHERFIENYRYWRVTVHGLRLVTYTGNWVMSILWFIFESSVSQFQKKSEGQKEIVILLFISPPNCLRTQNWWFLKGKIFLWSAIDLRWSVTSEVID